MSDLELAGASTPKPPSTDGIPSTDVNVNIPTFNMPHFGVPDLDTYDLATPRATLRSPLQPDPSVPDLLQPDRPDGLMIVDAAEPDPYLADLLLYDYPAGIVMPSTAQPDPYGPDLSISDVQPPQVCMSDRPGDLSEIALSLLHDSTDAQRLPHGMTYETEYSTQDGMATRSRRLAMLMFGLNKEEED